MQQPGLPSCRLSQLPLPLTPEYWEGRASRMQPEHQKQPKQPKHQQGAAAQQGQGMPSFPTLNESLKKQGATKQQQQPRGGLQVIGTGVMISDDDDTLLRQALLRSWPGALDHIPQALLVEAPQTSSAGSHAAAQQGEDHSANGGAATVAAAAAAKAAIAGIGGGRKQVMAATAGVRTGGDPAAPTAMAVQVGVEYEALDGRRFFASPQQLGFRDHNSQKVRPGNWEWDYRGCLGSLLRSLPVPGIN